MATAPAHIDQRAPPDGGGARALPTIRRRLAGVVLTCVFSSVVGFALLTAHFYQRGLAQIERDTLQTARAMALAVDRDLNSGKAAALALATSPSITANDFAAFHAQARSLLNEPFPGFTFVLLDRGGHQLLNTIVPFGQPLPTEATAYSGAVAPVFATGLPVVSDVFTGAVVRRPVVAITVPVWRDGKVAYALGVGFLPERLGRILEQQRLPPDRFVGIFDTKGAVVARTPLKAAGQKAMPVLVRSMHENSEGVIEMVSLEGEAVYAAFSRSPLSNWTVAIGVPRRAVLAELVHSVAWVGWLVLALLGAGFGRAWYMGGQIGAAVKALAAHAGPNAAQRPQRPAMAFKEAADVAAELARRRRQLEQRNAQLAREIGERERAELELMRNRDHLEELVGQRTAELAAAKERAEVANRTKGTFLANVSHELRTPLNAVLGYAQILKRDAGLNLRRSVAIQTIEQSGQHLLTLINDILDLAKVETGKLELYPSAFNLALFLRAVGDIIRIEAEEKGLRFEFDIAADLPLAVRADELRLRQVLLNLLSNAVKFTDRGQVGLRVRCLSCEGGQASLHFEIADTGIGLSAEQQALLFEPFAQVGATQRRHGGSGLGLAISRQLVRMMGSDIALKSKAGEGSCFSFDIRVPVEAEQTTPPTALAVTGYRGPRKTVLVADDESASRTMLLELLDSLGFDSRAAVNGEQALALARAARPDLIVLDMVMPALDGPATVRRMRDDPQLRAVPVIALSASAAEDDPRQALAAGADRFLPKPVDLERLVQQIGELLALEWETGPGGLGAAATAALVAPPRPDLEVLHSLALAGNMRDILDWSAQLESGSAQYRLFAHRVGELASRYQSRALLLFVDSFLARPENAGTVTEAGPADDRTGAR